MTLTSTKRAQLLRRLAEFAAAHEMATKGPLSMVLVITRRASACKLPLDDAMFVTRRAGQVAGLGRGAVHQILVGHGITRVLAKEGGANESRQHGENAGLHQAPQ